MALHHVFHAIPNTKKGEVLLYSDHQHLLTLPYKKETFESQIDRTAHFYYMWCKFIAECLRHCNGELTMNVKENIIHRRLKHTSHPLPDFTWPDFFKYLIEHFSWQAICSIFGKDNPYLEDIQLEFKLPPNRL